MRKLNMKILIDKGNELLKQFSIVKYNTWNTNVVNSLKSTFGNDSGHLQNYIELTKPSYNQVHYARLNSSYRTPSKPNGRKPSEEEYEYEEFIEKFKQLKKFIEQ